MLVDRTSQDERFCSVAVDDELGGRLGVEHLVDRGHRRVAFVGGPEGLGQVEDRYAGARARLGRGGLPPEDLVRMPTRTTGVDDGRDVGELLAGLPTRRRPTAAFCANDLLALGLLQQTVASGRSVPGDLAIVGYDDIYFAAAAAVPLTSVRSHGWSSAAPPPSWCSRSPSPATATSRSSSARAGRPRLDLRTRRRAAGESPTARRPCCCVLLPGQPGSSS